MTLTNDEIMALDADGLRMAVAEALGIKFRVSDGNMDFICGDRLEREYAKAGDLIGMVTCMYDKTISHEDLLPDWPGDLSAAWVLVEEMREAGREPSVLWHEDKHDWLSTCFGDDHVFKSAHGPTAPIAICRAYLMFAECKAGQ